MLFDWLLSHVAWINRKQGLEWAKGVKEREGSREPNGREPSIGMEGKMSSYSQHCLSKDFDKMKPIIIIIDCLVQFVPQGVIHTWAYTLKYTSMTREFSSCHHHGNTSQSLFTSGVNQVSLMAHHATFLLLCFQILHNSMRSRRDVRTLCSMAVFGWDLGMIWCWSVQHVHQRSRPWPGPRM